MMWLSQVLGLTALGVIANMYGCILMPILLIKIPLVVQLAWNRTAESKTNVPDVKEFLTFFKDEVTAREEAGANFVGTNTKDERVVRMKDPDQV